MFNTLTELFLHTYFLFNGIAGKLISEKKSVFDKLAAVFRIPEKERVTLFALTGRKEVFEIVTYNDYAQACRIQELYRLEGNEGKYPPDLREIVAVKGDTLRKLNQMGFEKYAEATETGVCKLLADGANKGIVTFLFVLGFMQCEGIFVEKNVRLGVKNLERAARWNSTEGILLSLYYDEKKREKNFNRLYTVTRGTIYEEVCALVGESYGLSDGRILPEHKLLQKAFGKGELKSELYDAQYSRFLFSEVLTPKDKAHAIYAGHKEAVAATADLPLKLTFGELAFQPAAMKELPIPRREERDKIARCAYNADMRSDAAYRPLCIGADSDYLLRLYLSAVSKAFLSAHVERIDVAGLNEYDFEPTKNNVFVRSCNEEKQNVYLLCFKGEIGEGVRNLIRGFLRSDKRAKFRLLNPAVEIDLSAVLPVCFCDKQNASWLQEECDLVSLAPVSNAEKPVLLTKILAAKAEQYKMKSVIADAAAFRILLGYSVDRAENVVDRAVRFNRSAGALTITADMLKELAAADAGQRTKFGFGGSDNDSK